MSPLGEIKKIVIPLNKEIGPDRYSIAAKRLEYSSVNYKTTIGVISSNTKKVIINYPGHNGSAAGTRDKYLKMAHEMFSRNIASVVLIQNKFYRGMNNCALSLERIRSVIKYVLKNSQEICGAISPDIYLSGFSAGGSAVAAIASEFKEIKKILLIAPSGDIDESIMSDSLPNYQGEVYIACGKSDFKVGPHAGDYYYFMAANPSIKKLLKIPFCGHNFSGKRNNLIRELLPIWAFEDETVLSKYKTSFKTLLLNFFQVIDTIGSQKDIKTFLFFLSDRFWMLKNYITISIILRKKAVNLKNIYPKKISAN